MERARLIRRYPVTILLGAQYAALVAFPALAHHTHPLGLMLGICTVATAAAFTVEWFRDHMPAAHQPARPYTKPINLIAAQLVLVVGVLADLGAVAGGAGTYAVQVGVEQKSAFVSLTTPFRVWGLFGSVLLIWAFRQRQMTRRAVLWRIGVVAAIQLWVGIQTSILAPSLAFVGCLAVLAVIMGLIRVRWIVLALVLIPLLWPPLYNLRNQNRSIVLGNGAATMPSASQRLRLDLQMSAISELTPKPSIIQTPSPLDVLRFGLVPRALDKGRPDLNTGSQFSVALGGLPTNSRTTTMLGNAYVFGGWVLVVAIPMCLAWAMGLAIRRNTPWGYAYIGMLWLYGISFDANWPQLPIQLLQGSVSLLGVAVVVRLVQRRQARSKRVRGRVARVPQRVISISPPLKAPARVNSEAMDRALGLD